MKYSLHYEPYRRPGRRLIIGIMILVMAVGLGVIWHAGLKDQLIPKRWGVVEDGVIFRSGQLPPGVLETMLDRHRIRQIVDLTFPDPTNTVQRMEQNIAGERGIRYWNYPLYGSGIGEVWNYAHAIAVMVAAKKENTPVLVHCFAGTQRTGGVVAAYRMLIEKKPPSTVYAELIRYGWNPEEDQVLVDFLNSRMEELATRLVEMELIDAIPHPLPVLGP